MPKTLLQLCENISLPDQIKVSAFSILLGLAEGDALRDADVQRAALNVICNVVCGPSARVSLYSIIIQFSVLQTNILLNTLTPIDCPFTILTVDVTRLHSCTLLSSTMVALAVL